jgi:hypothetical protein
VLRRLGDDGACGVVTRPSCTAGDLVELPGVELTHPCAVELGESGEQHGADGHVDADAQRVGSADHPQHAALGELFDQPPIFGQHPRVVHADALAQQPGQRLAERRREPEAADELGDRVPLLAGRDLRAGERLGSFEGGELGEVHHVDGRLSCAQEVFDRLVHRCHLVVEVQRHRAFDTRDDGRLAFGTTAEVGRQLGDVTERRRHEDELGAGERQ